MSRSLVILMDAVGSPSLLAVAGAEPGHIYGSWPGHTYGSEPGDTYGCSRWHKFISCGRGGAWSDLRIGAWSYLRVGAWSYLWMLSEAKVY